VRVPVIPVHGPVIASFTFVKTFCCLGKTQEGFGKVTTESGRTTCDIAMPTHGLPRTTEGLR